MRKGASRLGFRGSRLEELDVLIFLSSSERSQFGAAATACAHPPGVVEVARGISPTADRRRGLSTLGTCDEEVEKVKKPRTPVLFLREGVRECYYIACHPPAP
jgi:hypothetical protein